MLAVQHRKSGLDRKEDDFFAIEKIKNKRVGVKETEKIDRSPAKELEVEKSGCCVRLRIFPLNPLSRRKVTFKPYGLYSARQGISAANRNSRNQCIWHW